MKTLHTILVTLLLVLLSSCATEKRSPLEGVWELVSAEWTTPDTTLKFTPADWSQIKVITKSHFVFVGQEPNRVKISGAQSDAELISMARTFFGGGGTYSLEGDTCTETLQYFSNPNYLSASVSYKVEIEGTQLIQSGTYPAKSIGLEEYDVELYEVYRRIE